MKLCNRGNMNIRFNKDRLAYIIIIFVTILISISNSLSIDSSLLNLLDKNKKKHFMFHKELSNSSKATYADAFKHYIENNKSKLEPNFNTNINKPTESENLLKQSLGFQYYLRKSKIRNNKNYNNIANSKNINIKKSVINNHQQPQLNENLSYSFVQNKELSYNNNKSYNNLLSNNFLSNIYADSLIKSNNNNETKEYIIDFTNPNNILGGWFTISSQEFSNYEKFPNLNLINKGSANIEIENFTRVNKNNNVFLNNAEINTNDKKSLIQYTINSQFTNKFFYFQSRGDLLYYTTSKNDMSILDTIIPKKIMTSDNKYLSKVSSFRIKYIEDLFKPSAPEVRDSLDTRLDFYCFTIIDIQNKDWIMCSYDRDMHVQWLCSIDNYLSPDKLLKICAYIKEHKKLPNNVEETAYFKQNNIQETILIIPDKDRICNENWNYNLLGKDWECQCKEGKRQSPITLDVNTSKLSPIKPIFNYKTVEINTGFVLDESINSIYKNKLKIMHDEYKLKIGKDNNKNIKQVGKSKKELPLDLGNLVDVNGSVFQAEEIIFHSPAEHMIKNKRYDLEVQIIHYGKTDGDVSKHSVLCFIFKASPGIYNKFFENIDFFELPNKRTKIKDINGAININDLLVTMTSTGNIHSISEFDNLNNANNKLSKFSFFSYDGSLTSPPCTERTKYYVIADPIPLSNTIIKLFQEALLEPDRMNKNGEIEVDYQQISNIREIQPINDRTIFYYDSKSYDDLEFESIIQQANKEDQKKLSKLNKKSEISDGHFEKVYKDLTTYIYVKGKTPTDIPGALLVSNEEALKNLDS